MLTCYIIDDPVIDIHSIHSSSLEICTVVLIYVTHIDIPNIPPFKQSGLFLLRTLNPHGLSATIHPAACTVCLIGLVRTTEPDE